MPMKDARRHHSHHCLNRSLRESVPVFELGKNTRVGTADRHVSRSRNANHSYQLEHEIIYNGSIGLETNKKSVNSRVQSPTRGRNSFEGMHNNTDMWRNYQWKEDNSLRMIQETTKKLHELEHSTNLQLKELVKKYLIAEIKTNDPLLKRIDPNLAESLILIAKQKIYPPNYLIAYSPNTIGFLIYGRVKIIYEGYKFIIERGDSYGEHVLFGLDVQLKAKTVDYSCMLWLPRKYYTMLRYYSIKHALKASFNQLYALLRLSFIRKKIKYHVKKLLR